MFTTFLVSGVTDVDKMLLIYRRDGSYYVAFHEFVKSIMLGDRKYYRESQSPVMNVFDCGAQRNSSHFTGLRMIEALAERRGESTPQGQGYVAISELVAMFEEVFDNLEDCLRSLNRLVARQLVELNTRSTETIEDAEYARLTSAGWYYRRYLVQSFSYLDLILQDTPLNIESLAESLKQSVYAVDNLSDRDSQKIERMETRFNRVDAFISYLEAEEEAERREFGLDSLRAPVAVPITPTIRTEFEKQREWISRRIRENREKYAEDVVATVADEELSGDELYDASDVIT